MLSYQQTKPKTTLFFVCKMYYIQSLLSAVDVANNSSDKTYTATTLSKEEVVDNHISVLSYFCLSTNDDDCDLPSLYWIPKLHNNPYKQRYIVYLSKLLTSILKTVNRGLQSSYDTCYSSTDINMDSEKFENSFGNP